MFKAEQISKFLDKFTEMSLSYAPRILIALVLLFAGFKLVSKIHSWISKILEPSQISGSIKPFILSVIKALLFVALFLLIAALVGIELSIFTAIIAASVFAIGMSLQGSLGNLASGLLILSLKPFESEDWIEVNDKFGKVKEIGMFATTIVTPGNKTLIIPNATITSETVTNYSKNNMVRLEIAVSMAYAESYPKVEKIINEAMAEVQNILPEPKPEIGISHFDSHTVQLTVRPYTRPDHFWQVSFDTHKAIKAALSKNNIKMAYSEGVEMGEIGE